MHNLPIISFLEAHSPANYIDVQDVYYLYERETFVPLMNVPQQPPSRGTGSHADTDDDDTANSVVLALEGVVKHFPARGFYDRGFPLVAGLFTTGLQLVERRSR